MTDWEDFITKCPSCNNNDTCNWVHNEDEYHEKINKNGDIKCNNSSCYYYSHPTFIMEWTFDCGNHHGNYWKPDKANVWGALGMISSIKNLKRKERDKLYLRISGYFSDDEEE
jgi:hypothetical protein